METQRNVIRILNVLSNREDIQESDSLSSDLHLDSLEMVMLLVYLEDELQLELKESDMNPYDLQTVKDVVDLAQRYLEERNE